MTKKMHYCRCRVNLSGQNCHTVIYDEFTPVSWPEVQILMALHDDENVMDVVPISIAEVWPTQERDRLISIYGSRIVARCFPGRTPRMELMMTGDEQLPLFEEGKISTKLPPDPKPKPEGDEPPPEDDEDEDDVQSAVGNDLDAAMTHAVMKPRRQRGARGPELTVKEL